MLKCFRSWRRILSLLLRAQSRLLGSGFCYERLLSGERSLRQGLRTWSWSSAGMARSSRRMNHRRQQGAEELALCARVFWFDDRSARGAQLPADGGSYQRGRDDAKGWVVGLDLARSSLAGTGCNHLICSVSPRCCFDNQFSRNHMQSCYAS